ncbi:MAG: hypothetical protein OXJ54_09735 [Gemmatimonadetes bacterium]|nr:hypothetical protein [Candidatus Palauibacter rhopaloidicola]
MRSVRAARICLVLASAVLMSGCSALFMSRPPLGDGPLPEGTCATSALAPVLDAAMSAFMVSGMVAIATDEVENDLEEVGFVILGLPTAAWGYSAYKGFNWTSECRRREALSEEAIADHLRALARNAGAPDDS